MRINPFKTQIGSLLPNGIMELTTINSSAKLIYGRLCQFAGDKGYCWPAIPTLADSVGCSETTVKNAIKELKESKLIEVVHRNSSNGDASSNLYFFLDHAALHVHPINSGGRTFPDPPPPESTLPGPKTVHKVNQARGSLNSKNSSSNHSKKQIAAAQLNDTSPLPLKIEEAIIALAFGQDYHRQVRKLIIKQINSGISEQEIEACLIIFRERLPKLRNKNNPCSLLSQLFRVEAGKEHLEANKNAKVMAEATAQVKELKKAKYAKEQAKLSREAADWLNSPDSQRIVEFLAS